MIGEKTVMAIDPGSAKCGLALVRRDEFGEIHLVWRGIFPPEEVPAQVSARQVQDPFTLIVVGAGTRSKSLVEMLREAMPSIGILVVDERDTTVQARERYWEHNPRRGWRKLLPATLQTPPDPVDDFAALILAERVLQT